MKRWKRVTCCPQCGSKLTISEHYAYSLDFTITRKGVLSKKHTKSEGGPVDCMTAYCDNCGAFWDGSQTLIENEKAGEVLYLKVKGGEAE